MLLDLLAMRRAMVHRGDPAGRAARPAGRHARRARRDGARVVDARPADATRARTSRSCARSPRPRSSRPACGCSTGSRRCSSRPPRELRSPSGRPTTTCRRTRSSSSCSRRGEADRAVRADAATTSSATTPRSSARWKEPHSHDRVPPRRHRRAVLRSLVPVMCPPEAVPLADAIVDHIELTLGAAPPLLGRGFAAGLHAYDLGALPRYLRRARSPHRRARRALLHELGARPHADARAARARAQPARRARLLRAARDDGARRLRARAVDREGHAQAADRLQRRHREAGARRSSRPIRCAPARRSPTPRRSRWPDGGR